MRTANIRLLSNSLGVVSIITLFNILLIYWFPVIIPFSSFSAVRLMFFVFIKKAYWLILLSLLICVLLFLTAVSVHRQQVLLPMLSLVYVVYDFVIVSSLLIDGLSDGYWKTYVIHAIVAITFIVLLCIYCWNGLQNYLHKTDG